MSSEVGALAPIIARKALEVDRLRCAGAALWAKAESLPPAADLGCLRGGTVIAELKRRSPSGGTLRDGLDIAAVARGLAEAGAAALSVLTDEPDFGGTLDDLDAARASVAIPLLRKDFTLDPLQVAEARVAGADWVLLIAAVLDDRSLADCLAACERAGAHAIVEVHDPHEASRAASAGAACIGVNNRDLRTLRTDLGVFGLVRPHVPEQVVCVAESGVRGARDVAALVRAGADSVLVGEAIMRVASPVEACAALVAAAREAVP